MCEQTEIQYLDGEVVWVKLGSCWWPGEVVGPEKLPPDLLPSFRKPPIAVVKFFLEDTFEYVKNINSIYKYNCSRKTEFIKKGLDMYRSKHGHMEKFPEDVIRAEIATDGDKEILTRSEFQQVKKESYAGIFGEATKKTPVSTKRGRGAKGRHAESPKLSTPIHKINKGNSDYKVHILVQGSKAAPSEISTPSTSRAGSEPVEDKSEKPETPKNSVATTPVASSSGVYSCHACSFSTSRLNVMILHNKTHSVTFTPYTPVPVRKKPKVITKTTPNTPKARPKKEKSEKEPKKLKAQKRPADIIQNSETKKSRTDDEIKTSLLADWDDGDEESSEETCDEPATMSPSPKIPVAAESPAVPMPADLTSAHIPGECSPSQSKQLEETVAAKLQSTDSKYEFCEDEDWPTEADAGRKIPRIKNPSKRKHDTKSLSIDEDDVAKEVAELLSKTTVPELPSAPEPLKIEENFPEPSVAKSPDKGIKSDITNKELDKITHGKQATKTIFKTKTFFRSRHSRSQDAIGKYVAEQLNAAERMNMSDCELNGTEVTLSPEARDSPPNELVKIARLAPKIQLKKMKAECAQQAEREKGNLDFVSHFISEEMKEDLATNDTAISQKSIETASYTLPDEVEKEITENNNLSKENLSEIVVTEDIGTGLENASNISVIEEIEFDQAPSESVTKSFPPLVELCMNKKTAYSVKSLHSISDVPKTAEVVTNEQLTDDSNHCTTLLNPIEHSLITDNNTLSAKSPGISTDLPMTETSVFCEKASNPSSDQDINDNTASSRILVKLPTNCTIIKMDNHDSTVSDMLVDTLIKPVITEETKIEQQIEVQELRNGKVLTESASESLKLPNDAVKNITNESDNTPKALLMNETTASAVDALLSVSRDTDRVTKVISDDPPEDLFEDDNKIDNENTSNGSENLINVNVDKFSLEQIPPIANCLEEENQSGKEDAFINVNIPVEVPIPEEEVLTEEIVTEEVVADTNESENTPTESDLQIAEALMNLPSTALKNKVINQNQCAVSVGSEIKTDTLSESSIAKNMNDFGSTKEVINESVSQAIAPSTKHTENNEDINSRFETEQEKCDNFFAAQSLVQMSETVDVNVNNVMETESQTAKLKDNTAIEDSSLEQKIALLSEGNKSDSVSEVINESTSKFKTTSSKLLQMLEEPCAPTIISNKVITPKSLVAAVSGKEKILNFDVSNSPLKSKTQSPKQKIIIRRTVPNKNIINNFKEPVKAENIVLSRTNKLTSDNSGVQTYTIQATSDKPIDSNTIIIQQKIRKIVSAPPKLQKITSQTSLGGIHSETSKNNICQTRSDDTVFDINSMPIVLSDDILTPENIEKMPIVMSDGNIITNPVPLSSPSQSVKQKNIIKENEKVLKSTNPPVKKTELKTLLMSTVSDSNKPTTPNILSKSSKLRGTKPMLVIDKTTGKQKIIMTKSEPPVKEIKQPATNVQNVAPVAGKSEKFIILPTANSPRPGRTQKIVIDPQTGKAHVLVAKSSEPAINVPDNNKPVSAKLIPTAPDSKSSSGTGGTVMIITNAQGTQSRIVLTPEHEKLLFPNKQQSSLTQIKTIAQRQVTQTLQKPQTLVNTISPAPAKPQTKIIAKQKSAIITSKGQLIVGGRVATTVQNISPAPEVRQMAPKRILATEPKKLAVPKTNQEPLIFLQQKSGAVMQLTTAQFEHLQRTGQIVQKTSTSAPVPIIKENKILVQKSVTIPSNDSLPQIHKQQRIRHTKPTPSSTPAKKLKQEIALTPAPAPLPSLAPLSHTVTQPMTTSLHSIAPEMPSSSYPGLDNFEELLPSTAIVRQQEVLPPPAPAAAPGPAPTATPVPPPLSDGQLLAVPGEHFGGPPGSFYLCVEDRGTLTPIDNRPLMLENNQLVPLEPPERRDILEAALANSDVLTDAPDFRDLNANVSVHCRVSETSTTLNQPIMTPVEVPSKADTETSIATSIEDGLAVIGVTPTTVPTSLELPITVTDPRIAPRVSCAGSLGAALGCVVDGPGKSMPILTDDAPVGSWPRTPGSDSDASVEIPLQPNIQISTGNLAHGS